MPKPKKNKPGLHKNISSVLNGVPIPQGVRNWQPSDKSKPDQTGDSSAAEESNISSVFKGMPVASADGARPPADEQPQNNSAEVSPVETPNEHQSAQSNLIKKPDCPEESPAKTVRTRQPEFANKVVHYRDPLEEAANEKPEQMIQNNFFAPRQWLKHVLGFCRTLYDKKGLMRSHRKR